MFVRLQSELEKILKNSCKKCVDNPFCVWYNTANIK